MFISQTDDDPTHDHTYYGNGCPNQWMVTDDRPCTTRIVKDKNNEDQKNGTYYNFAASSSGTGGTITADNTNSPDTFCPLGWQLPYSGTGGDYYNKSRSWAFLLTKYENGLAGFPYYPFSYVFSGFYYWASGYGKAYDMTYGGTYWSLTNSNSTNAYRANLWNNGGDISGSSRGGKNYGSTLRCVEFSASLIDGTVAGTNIKFIDSDNTHNHTYFGNGGNDNATTAGPTNLTTTYDNEEQSIGTYYNFQAITSGTGRWREDMNSITPDTFCPLGWQLPYGGTGGDYYDKSRSWNYLLATYGIDVSIESELQNQKTRSYPMSIILTGNYYWEQGALQYFNVHTLLHSATIYTTKSTYQMYIWNKKVNSQSYNSRTYGMSARCVETFESLSPTARWQEQMLNLVIQIGYTTILITEMDVQMSGLNLCQTMVSRTSPVRRARSRQMMETKKLAHITILAQLQSTQIGRCTKIKMLLILSVPLVGNCLTVARVGIIMISLGLSIILLMNMESKTFLTVTEKLR